MKSILFVSQWYPANIGTFLSYAFEDAGYKVIRVGQACFTHYGLTYNNSELPLITERLEQGQSVNLPRLVDKYTPDILLMWDWTGEPAVYQVAELGETQNLKNRLPFIYVEHEGWENALKRIELFNPTVAYTGMPYGVVETPCSAAAMGYKYLAGACYPKVHYITKSLRDKDLDFIVMASFARTRNAVCAAMRQKGFETYYGVGSLTAYRNYHNSSLTTYDFSDGWQYVKWRVFEAMAMGCILLQDSFELLDMLGFVPDKHYVEYKLTAEYQPDIEDMAAKINMLKTDHDLADKIRADAYNFVMEKHQYSHRVQQILRDLGA